MTQDSIESEMYWAGKVVEMARTATDTVENWQQSLDVLLDAAAFIAAENNVPAWQAFERMAASHASFTGTKSPSAFN